MRNLKNKKLNNDKGFSFLLVIVAMSFVAILIAVMMLVAYQNYQMKHTGLKSEDNFYTAEQALDEIKAGLQMEVSDTVSEAYSYVLERYSETDGQDATRNWYFQTKYVDNLRASFLLAGTTNQFNPDVLESYLQKTKDGGDVSVATGLDGAGTMVVNYGSGLTLKGVKVSYTNQQGYLSVVSTDIRLAIPAIDFTQTTSSPELLEYCVVAEDGITVAGGVTATPEVLTGNVYAGTNGLVVSDLASLTITGAERGIFKEGVKVGKGAELNFTGNAMWTESIEIDSIQTKQSSFVADSNIFVKDDLTLNGSYGSAILSGRYYGFSNPDFVYSSNAYSDMELGQDETTTDLSSAIILNGRKSTLNLAGLDSIFIAGNAYINAKLGVLNEQPLSVQMGESITVKGNQLAYLAPENAIVLPENVVSTGGNPILNLPANANITLDVTVKLAELGNRSLSEFGIEADDCMVYYRPGITYVYMKFDSDVEAANYFNAYNKEGIKKYTSKFISDETFGLGEEGTISDVTLIGSAFETIPNTVVNEQLNSLQTEANGYQDMFFTFCKKLIPTYTALNAEEKLGTVFSNIVDVNALTSFLGTKAGDKFVYTTRGSKLQAVLIDGDYNSATPTTGSRFADTRLIVATGDVTIQDGAQFKGVIICGGKLRIGDGATITASPDEVSAAFQCVFYEKAGEDEPVAEESGKSPMSFFKDGQGYVMDGISSGVISGSVGSLIDLSDIIVYENWKKQ